MAFNARPSAPLTPVQPTLPSSTYGQSLLQRHHKRLRRLARVWSFSSSTALFVTKTTACCIDTGMKDTNYFLLGDVARILRCQPYQIVYLLTTNKVPEPALRIGNKRVFTLEDVHRIAERLRVHFSPAELTRGGTNE